MFNRKSKKEQSGFTIIELLVVIVVTGVLSVILFVTYNGIRDRAIGASLYSDLDSSSRLLKMYKIEHRVYPTSLDSNYCPIPADSKYCLKASSGNSFSYSVDNEASPPTFNLTATNGSKTYKVTNNTPPSEVTPPATPADTEPGAPTGLDATANGSSEIDLSWSAPVDDGGSEITGYKIYRSTTSGSETLIDTIGVTLSYQNTGLSASTTYYYKVSAINTIGESSQSNEDSAATSVAFFAATGGTITTDGNYKIHKFTSTGTFTVTTGGNADVLVVAGGGGGGSGGYVYASGGGAGGVLYQTSFAVSTGSYTVTIGNGGASNTNGQNSVFSSLTAIGGGHGGGSSAAGSGGSGGGSNYTHRTYGNGTSGQGYHGGQDDGGGGASGGGGAGAVGGNTTSTYGGYGGAGVSNSITGTATYYGGGGGGGAYSSAYSGGNGGGGTSGSTSHPTGYNGTANTGGGGGGGYNSSAAGSGGSGVVIIRYLYQ